MREELSEIYQGACEDGLFYNIDTCSVSELIEMYKRNPAFSLKNDIPSMQFIQDYFGDEQLQRYGVLVGKSFNGESLEWGIKSKHKGIYMLNRCNGELNFHQGEVVKLYVSNGCELQINVSNGAHVSVCSFGYSKLKASVDSKSKCTVILNQQSTCKKKGKVNIVKK